MSTKASLHEVVVFMSNSMPLYFRLGDLILLLIHCELVGRPLDESHMNHLYDS